jgi:hypothetical protein
MGKYFFRSQDAGMDRKVHIVNLDASLLYSYG